MICQNALVIMEEQKALPGVCKKNSEGEYSAFSNRTPGGTIFWVHMKTVYHEKAIRNFNYSISFKSGFWTG